MRCFIALGSMLLGCVPEPGETTGRIGIEVPEVEASSSLALVFEEASVESGVPADVLLALAYVETGFEPASGEVEFEGQPAPYGLFALAGSRLEKGAALSGLSVEDVMADERADVLASAALLRSFADEAGVSDEVDPLAWGPALSRWSEQEDDLATVFANDVLEHVSLGAAVPMADGTTIIIGRNAGVEAIATEVSGLSAANTVWRPSPNHSSRSLAVELVVIHTCEGSYTGCVGWLRNPSAGASAHYVVKENGAEVAQLVDENRKAWHVAANYRPSLNGGKIAHRSGYGTNGFSIGIEHGGRAAQRSWPDSQINRSVALVRNITSRHGIPRDRYHIVGHGRLQPENRTDPGPNWPWTSYLAAIRAGAAPPPSSSGSGSSSSSEVIVTVDNTTSGRFRASGAWELSSWAAGKVGSNYRFRVPSMESDTADYKVAVPEAGRYEVFARVPGNGYSTNVPYIIHHAGGRAVVQKDISARGASWVSLGTYSFGRVDDWIVQISCWTNGRGYVIADAIRFERR